MHHLWSAKLSGPSPHLRLCEALQLHVDLVQIKGLRIKLAPYPFQHLLVLGVLGIVDGFQETDISPDATAILGGTAPFAREAERVPLALIQLQVLFLGELGIASICKILHIEHLGPLAPAPDRPGNASRALA